MKTTYVIDSNLIAAELKAESVRLAVRRQRELDRERTFIFSEGPVSAPDRQGVQRLVLDQNGKPVMVRDAGVHGDSMGDELAAKAADFAAQQKAQAAAIAAA